MLLQCKAQTHQGRRNNNEDSFGALPDLGVFVVADGMGGYEGGEIASRVAVDSIATFFRRNADDADATWPYALKRELSFAENMIDVALRSAHQQICAAKTSHTKLMGTTAVVLMLARGHAVMGHVGDSRIYRLREGKFERLTTDHSLYEELLASGTTKVPSRESCGFGNVITRALGLERAKADLRTEKVLDGDRFLLCSDGLLDGLDEETISQLLARGSADESCSKLVQQAYEQGARDNITAVVVQVVGD